MAEKIIILSDGTGNSASSIWRTNVWRIFQTLDLRENKQAAKYDDGVGTSSFLPLAILGGAFGWGLKRNVLEAYKFICRNYQIDSRLYLFGFSRGAFTVRVLTGFILQQGLVPAGGSEADLDWRAKEAYRAYRASSYHSVLHVETLFRSIRNAAVWCLSLVIRRERYRQADNTVVPTIQFVGVWDTVAAYGLPIDELTRGISRWLWPLELPNRVLNPRVEFARHALALDDERTTFHPVLWTEVDLANGTPPATGTGTNPTAVSSAPESIDQERLVQVWFAGMHANVGGGYPDDALAFVPLYWLFDQAKKHGLEFKSEPAADPDATKWIASSRDKDGRLYDSRSGLGAYYRYGPRDVHALCIDPTVKVTVPLPKVHESVFGRIDSGCNAYAPIGLPQTYATVQDDGTVLQPGQGRETAAQAAARANAQAHIWNYVWLRRGAYFLSLAATFHLVAFWLFHDRNTEHEFDSSIRLVSEFVRLVESFLPRGVVHWWTDWYAGNPEWFIAGVVALYAFNKLGSHLEGVIQDSMGTIWKTHGGTDPVPSSRRQKAIYAIRTSRPWIWSIRALRLHIFPFVAVSLMVWYGLTFGSHLLFNVADSMGAYCEGTPAAALKPVNNGAPQPALREFDTRSICSPTGLQVEAGFKYEIVVTPDGDWLNGGNKTTPVGYSASDLPFWQEAKAIGTYALSRILFRPWFRLIARVGEKGVDEYFLDPVKTKSAGPQTSYKDTIRTERSGELFLYVNDAVIGLPFLSEVFYRNNVGKAKVTVRLLD